MQTTSNYRINYSAVIKSEIRSVSLIYIKYLLYLIDKYYYEINWYVYEGLYEIKATLYLLTKKNSYITLLNIFRCLFQKPSFLRMHK